ncbi:MAG: helix-turn-helix domain-containing protein, partial [Kiritimatiellae bacterium]|nr:helix-turn-helix domain-containing protein [Kiritimatiellia bacterium]
HTIVDGTFKRILGTTVSKEIAKARLETAHRLVTSSTAPFAEIAERSGFASIHYFTRSFTAAFGTSPSRLRNGKTRR